MLFVSFVNGIVFFLSLALTLIPTVLFFRSEEPGLGAVSFVMGFLISLFFSASVRVVPEWQNMLVLRFGRFVGVSKSGLRWVIPIVETTFFVEMRLQTVNIEQQQTITKDNVPVTMNGVIFFKVEDPRVAVLEVENYRMAVTRLAQAALRDVVGALMLDELLSHQEKLEEEIQRLVSASTARWGLSVDSIRIEDIDVPEDLKRMMSRQASSEREKRATIIKADGDRLAAESLSLAANMMSKSPGAMQLRTLQSIDGLGPSSSNTVILAIPMEFMEALRGFAQTKSPSIGANELDKS